MRLMRVRQELIGRGAPRDRGRSRILARGWFFVGGWLLVVIAVLAWLVLVPLVDAVREPEPV
jgi:hypothetical protein